mmetsp:Transcript_39568/g.71277  ORF Transcript_39568/g.71277 Transcript_39568/m.71277 type:complete len:208 (+) Transcript_39568:4920-5543(+)
MWRSLRCHRSNRPPPRLQTHPTLLPLPPLHQHPNQSPLLLHLPSYVEQAPAPCRQSDSSSPPYVPPSPPAFQIPPSLVRYLRLLPSLVVVDPFGVPTPASLAPSLIHPIPPNRHRKCHRPNYCHRDHPPHWIFYVVHCAWMFPRWRQLRLRLGYWRRLPWRSPGYCHWFLHGDQCYLPLHCPLLDCSHCSPNFARRLIVRPARHYRY